MNILNGEENVQVSSRAGVGESRILQASLDSNSHKPQPPELINPNSPSDGGSCSPNNLWDPLAIVRMVIG